MFPVKGEFRVHQIVEANFILPYRREGIKKHLKLPSYLRSAKDIQEQYCNNNIHFDRDFFYGPENYRIYGTPDGIKNGMPLELKTYHILRRQNSKKHVALLEKFAQGQLQLYMWLLESPAGIYYIYNCTKDRLEKEVIVDYRYNLVEKYIINFLETLDGVDEPSHRKNGKEKQKLEKYLKETKRIRV